MPGICGIISSRPAADCERAAAAMVASMEYEPFYRSGMYFAPKFGVYAAWTAHENSFATAQACFNEHHDVTMLLSGECFVDPEMRSGVRCQGHKIETNHLVHLYEEGGEQFIEKLNGLFSGLLIDNRQQKAFLFNDRYGAERIYWHQTSDAVYFASEAKALLSIHPELRSFDPNGVAQFLAFGCTSDWRTLFRGIELLPGGSLWAFANGACTKRRYFDSRTWESLPTLAPEDFESAFAETFERVLPRYLEANSEVGISLTGGLDTRMIMACLPQGAHSPVSYTFTGQKGETLDDRIARQVARACGLEHHLLRLGDDFLSDFASYADETVFVTDGCFGITGAHEIYFNSQARQLAPVRLTGVYGSEILRSVSTFKPVGLSPALINPEFAPTVSTAANEFGSNGAHAVTSAAFRDVPWNLFGSVAASRSQVIFRTPYLDNEIVALAFQAPEILRRSPWPALRLIENNSKALRQIPTDRRIEYKDAGLVNTLKRSFFEATFKLDYLNNEGMPGWLLPLDPILERINSKARIFGYHKYLHYRRWFERELANYVRSSVRRARLEGTPFWNADFLEVFAEEHITGRKNYTLELNAVMTLDAVDRLLLKNDHRQTRPNGSGSRTVVSAAVR